ncbi:MFS transporter [Streptomyces odontomachi]|uniref:MFS transporter n=1 Tax=Streptomyces odontomachi TaxID=2944940 RepID=UPI00210BCF12|nr:MFS transporter [Streptomyces sp. ODS25]
MSGAARSAGWALLPLLTATVTTTMANTVVNVPMTAILGELGAPLSRGVLVATAFTVTLAALMPLSGWIGDRLGRRRVLCGAMVCMIVGSVGAATAHGLGQLVAFRMLQGLAAAPVTPVVMVLVVQVLGPQRRGRAMSLWAAANGAGQALGPTTGGLLAAALGWRAVFWQIVPLSLLVLAGSRLLPADRTSGRATDGATDRTTGRTPGQAVDPARGLPRLDWRGALLLTVGAALLMAATSAVPTLGVGSPAVWVGAALGVAGLVAFVAVERGRADAFLHPRQLVEVRYVRSSFGVFAQMFVLGATLLAVPVYLVRTHGMSTGGTGLAMLALPLTMAVLAPVAGRTTERFGGRTVMRCGLLALLSGTGLLAAMTGVRGGLPPLVGALLLTGVGIAFVQTPAATGASRSTAGRTGAGLGVFNLIRFCAMALGSACVALLGTRPEQLVVVFTVCAAVALASYAFTYVGTDPVDPPPAGHDHARPAARRGAAPGRGGLATRATGLRPAGSVPSGAPGGSR